MRGPPSEWERCLQQRLNARLSKGVTGGRMGVLPAFGRVTSDPLWEPGLQALLAASISIVTAG